jgi:hypothetical protein
MENSSTYFRNEVLLKRPYLNGEDTQRGDRESRGIATHTADRGWQTRKAVRVIRETGSYSTKRRFTNTRNGHESMDTENGHEGA